VAGARQGPDRPGEFELIARLFAPLAAGMPDAYGLEDDVAYLALEGGLVRAGEELVLKTDALVAGVHFLAEDPADLVARKLLRVNLSDLAAKGARPLVYTLAVMLPATVDFAWLEGFARGLKADQAEFGITLAGGDTDSTPGPLSLSLTAIGAIPAGARMLRRGAVPGDAVFVSGTIGDGALGLKAIRGELRGVTPAHSAFLAGRYRLPQPRLALGRGLRGLVHAAMDVSDGLLGDLGHICAASGVSARIEAARVPLSEAGRAALAEDGALIESVLGGGDDYELLFTAPPAHAEALGALARECGVAVTRVGAIEPPGQGRPAVTAVDVDGRDIRLARTGFRHF
jgi:thiamine-monophosphate kinase